MIFKNVYIQEGIIVLENWALRTKNTVPDFLNEFFSSRIHVCVYLCHSSKNSAKMKHWFVTKQNTVTSPKTSQTWYPQMLCLYHYSKLKCKDVQKQDDNLTARVIKIICNSPECFFMAPACLCAH